MLLDRRRKVGRYLEWKVRLFAVGAVLGLAGIYTDQRWMTAAAIGVLALGMGFRFLPGGRQTLDETVSAEPGDDARRE